MDRVSDDQLTAKANAEHAERTYREKGIPVIRCPRPRCPRCQEGGRTGDAIRNDGRRGLVTWYYCRACRASFVALDA